MLHVRNFETAEALMAHYRALKDKQRAPRRLVSIPSPYRQIYLEPIGPQMPERIKKAREDIAKEQSRSLLHRNHTREILLEVCAEFDVSLFDILSPRRDAPTTRARMKAYYRLKNETTWSLPQIGRLMRKDHTSVLHGVRRFKLESVHTHLRLPRPSSADIKLWGKSGCTIGAYVAARDARGAQ